MSDYCQTWDTLKEKALIEKDQEIEALRAQLAAAERGYALCSLAARAREVVFDDPGDAVRWGELVNDWAALEVQERKP